MTFLISVIGGLLLAVGSGLIFLAILNLEGEEEDQGRVSEGWKRGQR